MGIVYFDKKDGSLSSVRTSTGTKNKLSMTAYPRSGQGGVTFKNGNITTRINNKGQCIGVGIKSGNHTTYFGKNGNVTTQLPSFV